MNKRAAVAIFLLTPVSALAQTQGSAPAMFGVHEVVVEYPRFANPKSAEDCGLVREEIAGLLAKTLQENGVPAATVIEAKPPMIGEARISLVPEISSFDNQGLDCTSWVGLAAESHGSIHVPPIDAPRSVTVSYWREGTLLASSQSTHAHVVDEALQKLAKKFAQEYRLDQPPGQ